MSIEQPRQGLLKDLLSRNMETYAAGERAWREESERKPPQEWTLQELRRKHESEKHDFELKIARDRRMKREKEAKRAHLERENNRIRDEKATQDKKYQEYLLRQTIDDDMRLGLTAEPICASCSVQSPRSNRRSSKRNGRGNRSLSRLSTRSKRAKKLYTSPRRKVSKTSGYYRTCVMRRRRGSKRRVRSPRRKSRFRCRTKSKRRSYKR